MFNIPNLSSRHVDLDEQFLISLQNGTLDAPNLLAEIPFKVSTCRLQNRLVQFYTYHHFFVWLELSTTQNAPS